MYIIVKCTYLKEWKIHLGNLIHTAQEKKSLVPTRLDRLPFCFVLYYSTAFLLKSVKDEHKKVSN